MTISITGVLDYIKKIMVENPQSSSQIQRAAKPEFLTETRFDEFDLPAEVVTGLRDAGFIFCTPIQAQTLPVSLTGRDVAGQAQTGTGKTAVFLVTLLTKLLALPERNRRLPSALVVTPTRELARQIYEEAKILARHTDLTMVQVVGGVDYTKQADSLRQGVDIIICTPGRIIDYFKQGIFKTEEIKALVIDEADRLLDLGFAQDMRYILRKLPDYEKRQSMLFSATLSYRVMELTYEFMNLPEFIAVTPETVVVEGIEQAVVSRGQRQKSVPSSGSFKTGRLEPDAYICQHQGRGGNADPQTERQRMAGRRDNRGSPPAQALPIDGAV